jgi:hypothetical protein
VLVHRDAGLSPEFTSGHGWLRGVSIPLLLMV